MSNKSSNDPLREQKQQAAEHVLDEVRDGMRVGLGTGSTARFVIEGLGQRVRDGLRIVGVPTSEASAALALQWHIPLGELTPAGLDVAIDGADEVDPQGQLIKGGGGALLREKLVAAAARRFVIVADDTKRVPQLGAHWAVPVEIVCWGAEHTLAQLAPYHPQLRQLPSGEPFVTDNGNLVADCTVGLIADASALHAALKRIVGVVETGLFLGMARRVVLAGADGVTDLEF